MDAADEVDTVAEEEAIAALLKDALAGSALIDGYDAYQALDDAWVGISGDLEVIQTEGKGAVRKVDPNMVVKKKNGKDVEVQDAGLAASCRLSLFKSTCLPTTSRRLLPVMPALARYHRK
mgnify:CR=1 FL=1